MLPHVRGEHLQSIQDKLGGMSYYNPHEQYRQWVHHADRVIKAMAAYILKDGLPDEDKHE